MLLWENSTAWQPRMSWYRNMEGCKSADWSQREGRRAEEREERNTGETVIERTKDRRLLLQLCLLQIIVIYNWDASGGAPGITYLTIYLFVCFRLLGSSWTSCKHYIITLLSCYGEQFSYLQYTEETWSNISNHLEEKTLKLCALKAKH